MNNENKIMVMNRIDKRLLFNLVVSQQQKQIKFKFARSHAHTAQYAAAKIKEYIS